MAHATVSVYFPTKVSEFEIEVSAEGNVTTGGSNRPGSDEPEWAEVTNIRLTMPNGKPVPRHMLASLCEATWNEITDALIEAGE